MKKCKLCHRKFPNHLIKPLTVIDKGRLVVNEDTCPICANKYAGRHKDQEFILFFLEAQQYVEENTNDH